ncbi:MAG: hypothetical protein ABIF09_05585, partial [Gemmatimonadota bacterium]
MKWVGLVAEAVSRLPIERFLVKPRDRSEDFARLSDILTNAHARPDEEPESPSPQGEEGVYTPSAPEPVNLEPRRTKVHLEPRPHYADGPTLQETIDYQNREIGKILLQLQRHFVQKFRISGKICDCGQGKHFLDLEGLAEETVTMVDNPVYERLVEWCRTTGPKCSVEAVRSGRYDGEYSRFAQEARDFR